MKKQIFYIALSTAMMATTACENSNEPEENGNNERTEIMLTEQEESFVKHNNDFAINTFKLLREQNPGANLVLSPHSLAGVLAMAANGAGGETRDEIMNALQINAVDIASLNSYYQKLDSKLTTADKKCTFRSAYAVWANNSVSLKSEFQGAMTRYFDAMCKTLDFTSPSAVTTINKWASDKTDGLIPKLLTEINAGTTLMLMNATYFQGEWSKKFDKAETRQQSFYNLSRPTSQVPMMHNSVHVPYFADDVIEGVKLPYGNSAFEMVLIKPIDGHPMDDVLAHVSQELVLGSIFNLFLTSHVVIELPRWEQENKLQLIKAMKQLGINHAFGGNADFSNLSTRQLFIDMLEQQAVIKVDEEGTKAAAVTTAGFTDAAGMLYRISFDHPFIYMIVERSTGAILFMGQVLNL